MAAANRKLKDFIRTYPEVIEDVRLLLGQPRAASVHASAIIVTPETRDGRTAECFDFLPVRKTDGMLVSEFDGYSVDEIGLLKEDVLATKELTKLSAVIALVNEHYKQELSVERITSRELEDEKTYRLLAEGNTQNVFQFSSPGITRFIQDVRPDCIEDLIAVNARIIPFFEILLDLLPAVGSIVHVDIRQSRVASRHQSLVDKGVRNRQRFSCPFYFYIRYFHRKYFLYRMEISH